MRHSKMTSWVQESTKISAMFQFIFGVASFIGFIGIQNKPTFLITLLVCDVSVQLLEFIFYIYFIQLKTFKTYYRYFDWFITTPTMLITMIGLMEYFNDSKVNVESFVRDYNKEIVFIISTNALMLSFGILGELEYASQTSTTALGFIPFLATFSVIFVQFAKTAEAFVLACIVFVIWSMYGFFALLPYTSKNIGYNVLDIFSKNLFGLFIAIYLLTLSS